MRLRKAIRTLFVSLITFVAFSSISYADVTVDLPAGWSTLFIGTDQGITIDELRSMCPDPQVLTLKDQKLITVKDALQSGKGYLIRVARACSVTLPGSPLQITQINISPGKQFIGAPKSFPASLIYDACPIRDIIDYSAGGAKSLPYSGTIKAFRAYIVDSPSPCTVQIKKKATKSEIYFVKREELFGKKYVRDVENYLVGDTIQVRVRDRDKNISPTSVEVIRDAVKVENTRTGQTVTVTLAALGTNSDWFISQGIPTGPPGSGASLEVKVGDIILAIYSDPDDPTDISGASATISSIPKSYMEAAITARIWATNVRALQKLYMSYNTLSVDERELLHNIALDLSSESMQLQKTVESLTEARDILKDLHDKFCKAGAAISSWLEIWCTAFSASFDGRAVYDSSQILLKEGISWIAQMIAGDALCTIGRSRAVIEGFTKLRNALLKEAEAWERDNIIQVLIYMKDEVKEMAAIHTYAEKCRAK